VITHFGATDIGRRRPLNEDAIHADGELFAVCDGMGGHKAGEVASQLAIDSVVAFVRRSGDDPEITWPYGFDPRVTLIGNRLRTAVKLANRAVFRKASSADDYTGMGTTIAVVLIPTGGTQMVIANVGDSRVYLVREGAIRQLTRDDSWAGLATDETLPATSLRNVLTKAIGAQADVDFDVNTHALQDGDTILLCSDGLTNMLSDARILATVSAHGGSLEAACSALVDEANAQGGRDNISAILVRYQR
jgi:protein phosphatase